MKRSFKPSALARQFSKSSLLFGCFLILLFSCYANSVLNVGPAFPIALAHRQIVASGIENREGQAREIKDEVQDSVGKATTRVDDLNHQVQSNDHLIESKVRRNVDQTQGTLNQVNDAIETSNQSVLDAVRDFFGK